MFPSVPSMLWVGVHYVLGVDRLWLSLRIGSLQVRHTPRHACALTRHTGTVPSGTPESLTVSGGEHLGFCSGSLMSCRERGLE